MIRYLRLSRLSWKPIGPRFATSRSFNVYHAGSCRNVFAKAQSFFCGEFCCPLEVSNDICYFPHGCVYMQFSVSPYKTVIWSCLVFCLLVNLLIGVICEPSLFLFFIVTIGEVYWLKMHWRILAMVYGQGLKLYFYSVRQKGKSYSFKHC